MENNNTFLLSLSLGRSIISDVALFKKIELIKRQKLISKQINLCLATAGGFRKFISKQLFMYQNLNKNQLDRIIKILHSSYWSDNLSRIYLRKENKSLNSAVLVLAWTKSEKLRDELKKIVKFL